MVSRSHLLAARSLVALSFVLLSQHAWAEDTNPTDPPVFQTVVTGTRTEQKRTEAVVATEVISAREIEVSGARDLSELLRTHVGVQVTPGFSGEGLRLQGLDPQYVLILIDGDRAGGRTNGTLDLSRFTLLDIERVEIVKGPASVVYGSDAMGGVLNLVTKKSRAPGEARLRGAYGSRNDVDARAAGGLSSELTSLRLDGMFRRADSYDLDQSNAATTGSSFAAWQIGGKATWEPRTGVVWSLRSNYWRRELAAIDTAAVGGAIFDRYQRTEVFDTGGSLRWALNDTSTVSGRVHASVFRDQMISDQRASRAQDQYQDPRETLGEAGIQWDQRMGRHLGTIATEGLYQRLASPRLTGGRVASTRWGVLAQDEISLLSDSSLHLVPGVRLDVDSRFGLAPSPRLAARWSWSPQWTARASVGMGFRAPSFIEQSVLFENPAVGYVVNGNPQLKPERSLGANASVDYRASDRFSLAGSLYVTAIRDLITVTIPREATADQPRLYSYANIDRAYTAGGEISGRYQIWTGLWLDLGYTLLSARDVSTGQLLEGRAVHRGNGSLTFRYRPWGLDISVRSSVVGPRLFRTDINGDGVLDAVWAKPYLDAFFRLRKTLTSWSALYVSGQNLFNAGDPLYLPLAPRAFQLGAEVGWW